MIIPLGFQCGLNSQFKLIADSIASFSENISIYLEDLKTKTIQDLRLNPCYTFSYDTLENSNRFLLHFEDAAFGIKDSKRIIPVEIYSYRDAIYIRSDEIDLRESKIFVYDLTGGLCFKTLLSERSIDKVIPGVVEGVYFVRLVKGENIYNVRLLLGKNL
jgi:glutamine phosphoribosylpyrophosphate amidotransferase